MHIGIFHPLSPRNFKLTLWNTSILLLLPQYLNIIIITMLFRTLLSVLRPLRALLRALYKTTTANVFLFSNQSNQRESMLVLLP